MLSGGEYNHDSLLLQGSARCYVSVMHLVVVVKELLGTRRHGQSLTTSRQPVASGDYHAWFVASECCRGCASYQIPVLSIVVKGSF